MGRVVCGTRKVRGSIDRLPKPQTTFDMTIVVAIDGDETSEDEEVGNRATEAGPESIPSTRLGVGTGVAQKPVGRISPEDTDHCHKADYDE